MKRLPTEQQSLDIRSVLSTITGCNVLVLPDAPVFTIVAVSDDYLSATYTNRKFVIGKGLFEVFPNNPNDPKQTSEKAVRASLEYALSHKEPHYLPVQRYDIPIEDGTYVERYWSVVNRSILTDQGDVLYLIHTVDDVTKEIITEQREARIRSIEKAYSLFMQAPVVIGILTGADHKIELANESILQVWGKTEDVIGRPLLEAIPELKDQGFVELLNQVRETGKPYYAYERAATLVRNGQAEVRYLNFVYQPYYADPTTNVVTGVFAVAHDVTDQVLARRKAEESEQRFQDLVSEATVATAVYIGQEMTIQYANEAMIRLWGKDSSVIGKTVRQALPELDGQPFHQQLNHVFTTGETYWGKEDKGEIVVDGELQTFYFNFSYKALRHANGTIYGILNMATDVTEQVLSKKRIEDQKNELQFVMDIMPQMVWQTRPDGSADFFNKVYFDYTGLSFESLEGHQWMQLIHPDDVAISHESWQRALAGEFDNYAVEHRLRGRDGSYRWFLTRVYPIKDTEGKITEWIGTHTDIDEQKQAEALLEQRVKERTLELEIRNKELEQFTYVSHHDLQEPLRKIIMFSDMIKTEASQKLSEIALNRLEKVTLSARRMSAALKDVLDYASLNKEDQLVRIDLGEVVAAVQTDMELVIHEKEGRIFADQLPVIAGVPQQMHQLFYNLFNNALKFSKSTESPVINIHCKLLNAIDLMGHPELDPSKRYYQIDVSDNGIGFHRGASDKIFVMFQRLHNRDTFPGTGIGLAMCKKVVTNHHGKIWAESEPGAGATFKIILPEK